MNRGLTLILSLAALALAACGTSTTSSSTTSTTSTPTTQLNPAVATQEVTASYGTLFNLASLDVNSKLAVIQNGASIKTAIAKALASPLAKQSTGATVSAVTFPTQAECKAATVPYPCARVTYSILGQGGSTLLQNNIGYAVYVGGKWVVAKITICTLLSLGNNNQPVQGC